MPDDVLSLRFDGDRREALNSAATQHGVTVSDLVRAAIDHVTALPASEVTALLTCPTCKGTGRRFKTIERETL